MRSIIVLLSLMLTAVAGGLQRYLQANGFQTRGLEATALVPVSLRSADEANRMGNRISALRVPLAVDVEDEPARLQATKPPRTTPRGPLDRSVGWGWLRRRRTRVVWRALTLVTQSPPRDSTSSFLTQVSPTRPSRQAVTPQPRPPP